MRKWLFILILILLLAGGIYGLYLYKKNRIIESIKDDIANTLSSSKFVVTDVQMDPDRVSINPLSALSTRVIGVVAEEVKVGIKSLNGVGSLKIGEIKMEYPIFQAGDVRFCSFDDTLMVYGDEKVALNFSLKSVALNPCTALNGELSPVSVALRDIGMELKDKKEVEEWSPLNARISSLVYSVEGSWQSLPQVEEADNLNSVLSKVNKWRLTAQVDTKNSDIWKLGWNMMDFSLNAGNPESYGVTCKIDKTALLGRGFLDDRRRIVVELTYNVQNLVVGGKEVSGKLKEAGIADSDLWPVMGSFKTAVEDLPSELIAASLILQREAKKGEPDQAVLGYLMAYLFGVMSKKELPLHLEASLDLPENKGVAAQIKGNFSLSGFIGDGKLLFRGLGRVMAKLRDPEKNKIEPLIETNLKCSEDREVCSGRIEVVRGDFRVYPEEVK